MLEKETEGYELKKKTGLSITSVIIPENYTKKVFNVFLKRTVSRLPSYFNKLGVVIDVQEIKDRDDFKNIIGEILDVLKDSDLIPSGVINSKDSQKEFLKEDMNLPIIFEVAATAEVQEKIVEVEVEKIVEVEVEKIVEVEKFIQSGMDLKIHNGIVRGGDSIYAENSHLLVIGSVKANAEISADGNIIVLGKLEGKAMAGAANNPNAIIFATEMYPTLISIDGNYKLLEENSQYYGHNIAISFTGSTLKASKY